MAEDFNINKTINQVIKSQEAMDECIKHGDYSGATVIALSSILHVLSDMAIRLEKIERIVMGQNGES